MTAMDTNKSDQGRILALLEKQRYPAPGSVFPTAAQAHALIETLIYLVQNTPPASVSVNVSVDDIHAALLKKAQRGPLGLG